MTKLRQVEQSLAQAERLSSLGEVVAGVAHELNNPLSGVVGYAELLRNQAGDPDQIRDLDRIVESALRCQKIVFKLLSFARKHAPGEEVPEPQRLCGEGAGSQVLPPADPPQIVTRLELDPALPHTSFDFHQLEQVILNLLNNAEQAVRSDPPPRDDRVTHRCGVRKNLHARSRTTVPGSRRRCARADLRSVLYHEGLRTWGRGWDLAVSYGIVQEHGGTIEVTDGTSDKRLSGAIFRIWLPIVEGSSEASRRRTPLRSRRTERR